jgi:glutathione S-transferase
MIRLITIRFSHFCEKARWALDRAGLPYREEPHLPVFAWGPALLGARHRTVPVLVTDDGERLPDSTDILRWVDRRAGGLYPADHDSEVAALEHEFDEKLGPATRRIAYYQLLQEPRLVDEVMTNSGPRWEVAIGRVARPLITSLISRGLKVGPEGAARSRKVVDQVFGRVAERISDGRRYLVGDRFTAADLSFAALAAAVVFPPAFQKFVLAESRWPSAIRAEVEQARATAAGRFAMRLYEER